MGRMKELYMAKQGCGEFAHIYEGVVYRCGDYHTPTGGIVYCVDCMNDYLVDCIDCDGFGVINGAVCNRCNGMGMLYKWELIERKGENGND